eukprot:SM000396S15195  [mRNA]  locus=s396:28666:31326:+ [translate_table: standard]
MKAVEHYRRIMTDVKARGLRIMLTLFHHSIPKWAVAYGGWTNERTVQYFADFARFAGEEFGDYVDSWVTFNEPHIFVILTHCTGTWPPGDRPTAWQSVLCVVPGHFSPYWRAMDAIGRAHILAYKVLHEGPATASVPVGVAHNVGVLRPYGLLDAPAVAFSRWMTLFPWIDHIQDHLDFCGLNYYGQEFISMVGLQVVPEEEYSEAGRAVYPDGLYQLLMAFNGRYRARRPDLKYIITENGMADARDLIRRPYLLEHLLSLHAAMKQGVPVHGYYHWTISDNWEWADGYCPKFGLVDVDRADNLTRLPRPSYELFTQVVKTRDVTLAAREEHWATLHGAANRGGERPFCRAVDATGVMWAGSRDVPTMCALSRKDWRYAKYEVPDLQTMLQRSLREVALVAWFALESVVGKGPQLTRPAETLTGAAEL